jgi:hypothetical protein
MNSPWVAGVVVPLVDKVPDPADVGPGLLGFVVFVALAVATVLLWLSFRRQLKKVNFEEQPDAPRQAGTPRDAGSPRDTDTPGHPREH